MARSAFNMDDARNQPTNQSTNREAMFEKVPEPLTAEDKDDFVSKLDGVW